jgi:hypothetical protein
MNVVLVGQGADRQLVHPGVPTDRGQDVDLRRPGTRPPHSQRSPHRATVEPKLTITDSAIKNVGPTFIPKRGTTDPQSHVRLLVRLHMAQTRRVGLIERPDRWESSDPDN